MSLNLSLFWKQNSQSKKTKRQRFQADKDFEINRLVPSMKKLILLLAFFAFQNHSFSQSTFQIDLDSVSLVCIANDEPIIDSADATPVDQDHWSMLGADCKGKPKKPPKGSCWQVCNCSCATDDGTEAVECWVQIAPGTQPNQANCPKDFNKCAGKGGKTGSVSGCRKV
jgi:hypothetical protein